MSQNPITFKPKQVSKKLLDVLPVRARDVIVSRYGLGKTPEKMTLDAIGKRYGITRERVRQIENYAITNIRKSKEFSETGSVFKELEAVIKKLGSVITEEDLLSHIHSSEAIQNHINFLLTLGSPFKRMREDDHFKHRWHIDDALSQKVHQSLQKLYESLSDEDLITEPDILKRFLENIKEVSEEYRDEEILRRWLRLSKKIGKNPLGEWGIAHSPNIHAKGVRDYAFLVIRKHGSPIHFTEVAKKISEVFGKKAHIATTHNELIKDPRFVLVGRGLYALKEWGYLSGVVKDVIKKVLHEQGPQTKEQVIDKVLKERYVKENTILVNLQNQKYFKKDKEGKYSLVS